MITRFHQEKIRELVTPNKVVIIYGPRRVGKTTLAKNFVDSFDGRVYQSTGENTQLRTILESADFSKIIPFFQGYDLVFIDADKRQYLDYYKLIIEKIKPGAYILADNVLWGGKVVENPLSDDEYTKGIINFNNFVSKDKRVENMIIPIRDGLMLLRKNS